MATQTHRLGGHAATADHLPMAKIKKGHLSSLLWLTPFGALCLCGWFVYRDFVATGPKITIYFQNSDGVEEKNTQLKYRGATIGQVTAVALTKDNQRVKVSAQLIGSARKIAREGSIFWIVRPEVKVGQISGLRTIVSGEYISVQPGYGAATNIFTGAEKEPITEHSNALQIVITTPDLGSMQAQTPIFYRGIQVGQVLYYQLAEDARDVRLHAAIWEQFKPLVRVDSKFWNAGGLSIHAGLFKGVQISAESPETILSGGIEFATPPGAGPPVTNDAMFVLNEKPEDKWKEWSPGIPLELPQQADQTNATPKLFPK